MEQNKFNEKLTKVNALWKPFGFWSISVGIFYIILAYPVTYSILSIWGIDITIPEYMTSNMMPLVTLFLGSAGIRYLEKKNKLTDVH